MIDQYSNRVDADYIAKNIGGHGVTREVIDLLSAKKRF